MILYDPSMSASENIASFEEDGGQTNLTMWFKREVWPSDIAATHKASIVYFHCCFHAFFSQELAICRRAWLVARLTTLFLPW